MLEKIPFGRTGHESTRILFGAAALGAMSQKRADATLELIAEAGVNHIDTAASYGESELRLKPFLARHRAGFFLASKTGARDKDGARESLERSLERLGVDSLDLIQLHNLVDETEHAKALGPGGALEALIEARAEGLVRFIGVTGHGTQVAKRHRESLERFPFDSILLPCNPSMLAQPDYAKDFETVVATCAERGVAVQTIKSIARRRWRRDDSESRRLSWYEPLRDAAAIERATRFVLARPGLFLNTTSDATLLPIILEAAQGTPSEPDTDALDADAARFAIEPLFVEGVAEGVGEAP